MNTIIPIIKRKCNEIHIINTELITETCILCVQLNIMKLILATR